LSGWRYYHQRGLRFFVRLDYGSDLAMHSNSLRFSISQLITDQILYIGDGYRAKNEEFSERGIPFARVSNVVDQHINIQDADLFPEKDLWKVGNKISQTGDVVFTSKGTVGRFAFVDQHTPRFIYSPQLCFWRVLNPSIIYPRFLYYWMQGKEFLDQFSGVKGQTDMADYVSLTDQRRMFITLPTLHKQIEIASTIEPLESKIELNRKMNQTLEAMARAIFKSWFVDFDPVRAKVEGRSTGLPAEIEALFPDGFEESALGEIPRGWKISTIGEEVEVVGGGTPSTKNSEYWENGTIHWTTPKDLSKLTNLILIETERHITEVGLAQISSGLLPVGTILLSSRAPIGYLAVACVPTAINQGFIAMKCTKSITPFFALFWAEENLDEIKARANGTTFMEISKKNFRPMSILIPDANLINEFSCIIDIFFKKLEFNQLEITFLMDVRNFFLKSIFN
jgi:type I restriction enzyme, S subunit